MQSQAVGALPQVKIARPRARWQRLMPLWLLLPSLIVLAVLQVYPTIYTIYMSFHRLRARQLIPEGLRNYERLLNDTNFWASLQKSFIFVGTTVALTLAIGLLIAVLLNQRSRFNPIYMVLLFIPWVISDVVAGTIWRWMFQNDYGLIQTVIAPLTGPTSLYARPDGAMLIVILATVWRSLPFTSLLFLGALQNVPTEVIESAALDGANRIQSFFRVTFPIIRPTFLVALILTTISGLNSVGVILVLTGNIPATKTASVYLYQQGWQFGDFGLGAAVSVVMFFINLLLTLAYLQFQGRQ
ncbi:MAG: carbohydrate ABC transporter permease [Candidatus Flexifilum sp.]|jgi:ABC-type sugar transport system permease subunit